MPDEAGRVHLMDELHRRYGGYRGFRSWRYVRKRYAWVLIVGGARLLKRLLDVSASAVGLLLVSPLLLAVALAIKLTDGGPVLFWQTRVGRWGREFRFPKFRSMVNLMRAATRMKTGASRMKPEPAATMSMVRLMAWAPPVTPIQAYFFQRKRIWRIR